MLETGAAVSIFAKTDCTVFAEFTAEHDRGYPHCRLELADLAGEKGVPDAEPACCLLTAPSRLG
jgi:hypothetical protein